MNTKAKINTRNNILRKLINSKWGAVPSTVRATALALCLSTAEYACSTWSRSCHTKLIDTALNDTCRSVTGCIKTTPIPCIYALAGIAPPHIRRSATTRYERAVQVLDERQPLHGHIALQSRLRSRNSFLHMVEPIQSSKEELRTNTWLDEWNSDISQTSEWIERGIISNKNLASGHDLGWTTWKTLNRLRVEQGRCQAILKSWRATTNDTCSCGLKQTMHHLLQCVLMPHGAGLMTWQNQRHQQSPAPSTSNIRCDCL